MELFPERVLKCMSPADRRRLKQQTAAESSANYTARLDREEQRLFSVWLYRHELDVELTWNQQAMHRRATSRTGWPDFLVLKDGKCLALEFKAPHAKLTPEQTVFQNRFEQQQFRYVIARSCGEAIAACRQYLFS